MRRLAMLLALCVSLGASVGLVRYVQGQEPKETVTVPVGPRVVAVRLLFGLQDAAPARWDGALAITAGSVIRLEGWRFRQGDQIEGTSSWRASTRRQMPGPGQRQQQRQQQGQNGAPAPVPQAPGAAAPMTPNGVIAILNADPQAEVRVTTPRGEFSFRPWELAMGQRRFFLERAASVERVPPAFPLTQARTEDDFPAVAADRDGTLWVTYVAYRYGRPENPHLGPMREEPKSFDFLRPTGNGDQVRLARFSPREGGAAWSDAAAITEPGQDVMRPAVAVAGDGSVWVVWSQNVRGNWDLYARRSRGGALSPTTRLTTDPGPDLSPVLTSDRGGAVWLAWQGFRAGNGDIFLASLERGGERWSAPARVSASPRTDWDPQLACERSGAVYVVWDTYDSGSYDVMLRRMAGGRLEAPIAVANSARFEARPAVVCDAQDRVWIAWEEAPEGWGKDFGYGVQDQGIPLYRRHTVALRCYVAGRPYRTAADVSTTLPGAGAAARPRAAAAQAQGQQSFPRLGTDETGRVFLAFRRPHAELRSPTGTAWLTYVTAYDGNAWSAPAVVPDSDALLDNRPALVAGGAAGPLSMVYSSDGRNHAFGQPVQYRLFIAPISWERSPAGAPALAAAEAPVPSRADPAVVSEGADIARMRTFRARVGGKTLQLLRGEFHRHTEISQDGGGDGALMDMFRYALDAGNMDWLGNGDHDNGGGREYTWWLIQKLTDAFHLESRFTPMFTYERSVRYPDGHRNVMFAKRGIRTLPRLAGEQPNNVSPGDTKMLYRYLRAFDGICASHTSATDMGTDWRDNDPEREPFVEIYQGDRQNYEYQGAPRSGTAGQSPGGFQPAGFVWNALAKGYRLGFQASSDHVSTHISYAVVYAERPTREAILEGFKKRHCYGATDNIVLEVRDGEHMMGDEFETRRPPRLEIHAIGTKPVARVVVVKDNRVVYTTEPNQAEVRLTWVDNQPAAGVSYYYVRVEQADGQLAWASPMWVRYRG